MQAKRAALQAAAKDGEVDLARTELTRYRLEMEEAAQEATEELEAERSTSDQLRAHIQTLLQEGDLARAEMEQMAQQLAGADHALQDVRRANEALEVAEAEAEAARRAHGEQATLIERLEGDLGLMYRRHKEEMESVTRRHEGAAARCSVLAARCSEQEEAVAAAAEAQSQCEQLHAMLTESSRLIVAQSFALSEREAAVAGQMEGRSQLEGELRSLIRAELWEELQDELRGEMEDEMQV